LNAHIEDTTFCLEQETVQVFPMALAEEAVRLVFALESQRVGQGGLPVPVRSHNSRRILSQGHFGDHNWNKLVDHSVAFADMSQVQVSAVQALLAPKGYRSFHKTQLQRYSKNHNLNKLVLRIGEVHPALAPLVPFLANRAHNSHKKMSQSHFDDYSLGK
jgi:hypothetical protein